MLYGWDVSTSIVGLATFEDDGKFSLATYCDLRKVDGLLAKADYFDAWLRLTTVNIEKENFHFVEERLGGFAVGRTSAQVLMKLGQFNALVSYIVWNHCPGPHRQIAYLHPSTWKSLMKREGLIIPKGADKKELTLDFVRRKEPSFVVEFNRNDRPQPWMYDEADAYCIGKAGYCQLCIAKESSQP